MTETANVLDELTVLQIELSALSACCERPNFDPLQPPGSQITDNDYRAGIREHFADDEDWKEWMVEPLLVEMKRHVQAREMVDCLCAGWLFRR